MSEIKNLVEVRASCALAMPTLAYLLFKFDIVYANIPTAKASLINGKYLIELGEEFWSKLTIQEKSFLLLHEVLHIFLFHFSRMKDCNYNPVLWNIATDYFINYTLKGFSKDKNGFTLSDERIQRYLSMPKEGLFDKIYIGMSADEIYQKLKDDAKEYSESDLFDEIGDAGSEDDQKKIQQDVNSAIICGSSMGNIGNTEAGILRTLAELIKPKINWKDFLKTEVDRNAFQRYTYNKYNKLSGKILFPRRTGEFVKVVFGVDTSGSMSENDLQIALGGVYEILNQYEEWELMLVTCDVKAVMLGHYRSENGDNFESVNKNFIGGGGTDLTSIVELANEMFLDEGIELCVIYTDGHIPKIKTNFLCETIFLITPNGNMYQQENTKTVRIEV